MKKTHFEIMLEAMKKNAEAREYLSLFRIGSDVSKHIRRESNILGVGGKVGV